MCCLRSIIVFVCFRGEGPGGAGDGVATQFFG